jgi:hypothetical protein
VQDLHPTDVTDIGYLGGRVHLDHRLVGYDEFHRGVLLLQSVVALRSADPAAT